MFESLTRYISDLNASSHGEWIVDRKNDGSPGHPIQMPFVDYDEIAVRFMEDVSKFIDAHQEMSLTHYGDILERNGLKWSTESMTAADASKLDGQAVMALIVGAIRADRFCDGALLEFLENGSVARWLRRLKEIDDAEIGIDGDLGEDWEDEENG